ncbi:MAG: hypothetical protein BWK72_11150 [Rhodoferax ferrireducens]|uniref:Nucleotidyltransferase family protein n=1 Tax=Rhodoferax ferrireducens TaxID=192843 RepID=A0A1W9KTS4_9BURK|nr:MAG: hypothetical protein BWK72_11150 [Rhodoferax ferrireducens]
MTQDLLSRIWAHENSQPLFTLREWEVVLGQARQARLLGRLAQHHVDHGWMSHVPEQPKLYLEGALRLLDRQHYEVQWEVNCIERALERVSCPVVMLKGAAYFVAALPPRLGRLFSDVDIMVPQTFLPQVEGALFRAGWLSNEQDAYNQRYYRVWMHEIPPLKHVQRQTVIDVHHTITPPTSRFKVDGRMLLEKIQSVAGSELLFVLSPADMVLHSAVHLFQEGEFERGLRDLLDLKDLLQHFSRQSDFWLSLFDRADQLGLQIPLFHALFHIQRLFSYAAPEKFQKRIAHLAPPAPARVVMAWLLELALRPAHPSCNTRWTGLARWLLYVRSHALRMPMHLAIPHLIRKAWMQRFPNPKETQP